MLNLVDVHDVELKHRLSKGWAKFMTFKKELCDKSLPIDNRVKLFNATVTPTVLYGCGTWAMTTAREDKLRTAQRRMLRMMLGRARQVVNVSDSTTDSSYSDNGGDAEETQEEPLVESWVAWVKRVTEEAENILKKLDIPDWVQLQRRTKWTWAGHVARYRDGRWTRNILEYLPVGRRAKQRPITRWDDGLDAMVKKIVGRHVPGGSWMTTAKREKSGQNW